ncbi:glycosyltransferase family 2 protein [Maricaulis maris]|uniref:glycosyltransferase family 2 protein n=1 Tax=Maricaulis maris TaxID=74318 RepID=UPI002922DC4A|nr:hypothetical protein MACH15_24260 [Maricaulis maris]
MTSTISFAAAVPIGSWHAFIPKAFESLATQEVSLAVALLDASGDARVALAADESRLPFAYRRHGPDKGQSDAIDEGWRETHGSVVFWLNGDDRLTPDALKRVNDLFEFNPGVDVVYGRSNFIDGRGRCIGHHDQIGVMSDLLYRSNIISQPSCFVRRSALNSIQGIDKSLHYVMDWDLWIRLYRNGARFLHTNDTYSEVYVGRDTKTGAVSPDRLAEVFNLVRRHAGYWSALKSTISLASHTLQTRRKHA